MFTKSGSSSERPTWLIKSPHQSFHWRLDVTRPRDRGFPKLWQRENVQAATRVFRPANLSTGGEDGYVLLPVLPLVRNGHRLGGIREFGHPKLLTRLGVQCAKARVDGCADEH